MMTKLHLACDRVNDLWALINALDDTTMSPPAAPSTYSREGFYPWSIETPLSQLNFTTAMRISKSVFFALLIYQGRRYHQLFQPLYADE
ncbi:hypothetical protein GQ53DRAFT_525762 [Thozetella sp. PMI_491]|nr:hypothetical protein GQ53DRAFT_525762 [Thozetella sp. PMI_491]